MHFSDAQYDPRIFEVTDIDQAKKIILTNEDDISSDERWERETPYLMKLLEPLNLNQDSLVLDFGCGIGRIAKELILKYRCFVVGTDISFHMRAIANIYTPFNNFVAMDNVCVERLNLRFDAAIAIWSIQHSYPIEPHIQFIAHYLKDNGKLFVVNERTTVIPTDKGWVNDGTDTFMILQKYFDIEKIDILDPTIITEKASKRTFYGILRKK